MGGRGSAYKTALKRHLENEDDNPQVNVDINDFYTDIETEYHNEMFDKLKKYKISVRQSTDDIDDKIFERQEKTVLSIAKKYNKILSYTTELQDIQLGAEMMNDKKAPIAYCLPALKNGRIIQRVVINKKYLQDYDTLINTVNYGIKEKEFVAVNQTFNNRDYVLTHEFGHVIENSLFQKYMKKQHLYLNDINDYDRLRKNMAIRIKNEVINICQKNYFNDKIINEDNINLSNYSTQNAREWFAETFTNLELAEEPAPIALALGDYLKEHLENEIL